MKHISRCTAKTITTALISSRLEYCNSLLDNIAKRDLAKLQRVQNCLARVVLRAPRFSSPLPPFRQLHWLPVSYRINFKLSTLTYCALSTQQPPYFASLLHLSNISRKLRSSISQQLIVPKTKLNLGKCAFSVQFSKLHFHHKSSIVPRSDNYFCASLFTIMLNDSVLLRLLAQVPEDISAI